MKNFMADALRLIFAIACFQGLILGLAFIFSKGGQNFSKSEFNRADWSPESVASDVAVENILPDTLDNGIYN